MPSHTPLQAILVNYSLQHLLHSPCNCSESSYQIYNTFPSPTHPVIKAFSVPCMSVMHETLKRNYVHSLNTAFQVQTLIHIHTTCQTYLLKRVDSFITILFELDTNYAYYCAHAKAPATTHKILDHNSQYTLAYSY